MTDILLQKTNKFIEHFNFTIEDIENEVGFAYEAEYESEKDDMSYTAYYSLYDEVKITYHVNDVKSQINELVTEVLTTKNND